MLLYSDIKFDQVALRYFYIEYYTYEEFVKKCQKYTQDPAGISEDVEMMSEFTKPKAKKAKGKIPLIKMPSGEYMDWDKLQRTVSLSQYSEIHSVSEISDKLIEMDWIYFVEESCNKILYNLIDKKIIKYEKITNRPVLDKIHEWFQKIVIKWLARILETEPGYKGIGGVGNAQHK